MDLPGYKVVSDTLIKAVGERPDLLSVIEGVAMKGKNPEALHEEIGSSIVDTIYRIGRGSVSYDNLILSGARNAYWRLVVQGAYNGSNGKAVGQEGNLYQ